MRYIFNLSFTVLLFLGLSACQGDQKEANNATDTAGKSITGKTPVGYAYEHLVRNGGKKPKEGDMVKYHQIFLKNDSLMLQSSYYFARPFEAVLPPRDTFAKQGMQPPAFYDALFLMSAGDSLIVHMDLDTFAPNKLPQGFTNQDKVSYVLKLISFKNEEDVKKEQAVLLAEADKIKERTLKLIEDYKSKKLKSQLTTTKSGLKYIIHEAGTGEHPKEGTPVHVNYTGFLLDGTNFDNSYSRMKPYNFRVGKGSVIQGWDEGIALLKPGGSATLFVPAALGYGATKKNDIPANSELVFHVKLEKIGY